MWGLLKKSQRGMIRTSSEFDLETSVKLKAPCGYRGFTNSTYSNYSKAFKPRQGGERVKNGY